jgi:hypothetical protein
MPFDESGCCGGIAMAVGGVLLMCVVLGCCVLLFLG